MSEAYQQQRALEFVVVGQTNGALSREVARSAGDEPFSVQAPVRVLVVDRTIFALSSGCIEMSAEAQARNGRDGAFLPESHPNVLSKKSLAGPRCTHSQHRPRGAPLGYHYRLTIFFTRSPKMLPPRHCITASEEWAVGRSRLVSTA
jgi:hypothetical protein